ncbi:MAG: hypothetical protein GY867_09915 [bacterium]|nr:hypothetical protein [bacterium]
MKLSNVAAISILLAALSPAILFGRSIQTPYGDLNSSQATMASPAYCIAEHNVGEIVMAVDNAGHIGDGFHSSGTTDCFTGLTVHACEFPAGSNTRYLFAGAIWIGAVVGGDTLVSTGADGWSTSGYEYHPEILSLGDMVYRSSLDPLAPEYWGAVSEQDYVAVYYDTCNLCPGVTNDPVDGRSHAPLNLEVTQESYAWSYPYAEDFVLFNYKVRNTGVDTLHDVYFGMYVDADVKHASTGSSGALDDLTGLYTASSGFTAPPIAWIADLDGNLGGSLAVPAVTGVCFLNPPESGASISYNWWINSTSAASDFGPRRKSGYRDFGTGGMGTPEGDRNKYHVLSSGEIDYDQAWTAQISALDPTWMYPPPTISPDLSDGKDTRYLLSMGPITIEPGEEKSYVTAYVAGDNFHSQSSNGSNLPDNPAEWYDNVEFDDLAMNATWASWVYDNPGVDTDGDGYAGTQYAGDGVPDFRAAAAPPEPVFWLEPKVGAATVRWNGHLPETFVDPFSSDQDFEGYNVYMSTSGAPPSFIKLASYDFENYFKFVLWWGTVGWQNEGDRFTLEEMRCLYADSCADTSWHPLDYDANHPYILSGFFDSIFYFDKVALNASELGVTTPIIKRYPAAPEPPYSDPSEVPAHLAAVYLTDDGYFKFYEYEYTIDNLLPGIPFWISVSAFDCGSIKGGVGILESPVFEAAQVVLALPGDTACCIGGRGNVLLEPDCSLSDQTVDIVDLQLLVDHMFLTFAPLCCEEEADVDASGEVDITDTQVMIDHQFLTLTPLPPCP